MIDAHRRTLDQLPTGVAIFGSNQRLTFYNAAYRALWELDAGLLDQHPADSAVIEQLRTARKLPEEQDFRQWKAELQEAYRAIEPKEHTWHLPDGRTLRVVSTPNPDGALQPGVYCPVELKIPRQPPGLIVPASAIIFNQNGMQVAVVENGVVHLQKITITTDYGTEVEVNEGVKDGDEVILQPPVNLADGDKVQIVPEPPQATP